MNSFHVIVKAFTPGAIRDSVDMWVLHSNDTTLGHDRQQEVIRGWIRTADLLRIFPSEPQSRNNSLDKFCPATAAKPVHIGLFNVAPSFCVCVSL